ncbi:hypothetical protein [Actinoplanes sp. NPDC049681]|uniref:hypothetical protein n=1 Tax=Actinoplanes sp. NPDC049681 TaxID=3363905 RepID=UPI0037B1D700
MIVDVGGSSPAIRRRSAVLWIVGVAVLWLLFAAERLLAYRVAGFGPAVLVLHALGWVTATVVTVFCVVTSWRRSRRSLAAAAAALGLLSAGAITVVDWSSLHARSFYRENRQDFATLVEQARQGRHNTDAAGGSQLSDELAHLSSNGLVGATGTPEKSVLFVPANAARGDIHRNGAGKVHGCAIGFLNPEVGMPSSVATYEVCSGRTALGDGWYWAD